MEWQPIETAPKDGTRILALSKRGIICEIEILNEDDVHLVGGGSFFKIKGFTHWMPKPALPNEKHECRVGHNFVKENEEGKLEIWQEGYNEHYSTPDPRFICKVLYCPFCGEKAAQEAKPTEKYESNFSQIPLPKGRSL